MNIVYFTHYTDLYGANKSLLEIVDNIRDKDINPIIISPNYGELNKRLDILGIKNYYFGYDCWVKSDSESRIKNIALFFRYKIKNTIAIIKIMNLLTKLDVSIIHTNSSVIDIGARIARKMKIKHIWHIREFGKEDYNISFYKNKNNAIQFILKNSNVVICISNSIRESYFKKYDFNKIKVIYNAVDLQENNYKSKEIKDKLKIIFAGNIMESKNQLEAVKAINYLNYSVKSKIQLDIVGTGNEKYISEIKSYIKKNNLNNNVNFLGHINDIQKIYKSYDIGIISSVKEGFGRVTIEYMGHGITPIASNTGANTEIINNGVNGIIYELGNYKQLSESINRLYNDSELRKEISNNARKHVIENFSIDRLIEQINTLYNELR